MKKVADQYESMMDAFLILIKEFLELNFVKANPPLKEAVFAILNDSEMHQLYPNHRDKMIRITDFDPLDPIDQISKNKESPVEKKPETPKAKSTKQKVKEEAPPVEVLDQENDDNAPPVEEVFEIEEDEEETVKPEDGDGEGFDEVQRLQDKKKKEKLKEKSEIGRMLPPKDESEEERAKRLDRQVKDEISLDEKGLGEDLDEEDLGEDEEITPEIDVENEDLSPEILDALVSNNDRSPSLPGADESEMNQIQKLKSERDNLRQELKLDPENKKLKKKVQDAISKVYGWEQMIERRNLGHDVSDFNPEKPQAFLNKNPDLSESPDVEDVITSEISDKLFTDEKLDPMPSVAKKFVDKFLAEKQVSPRLKRIIDEMSTSKESNNLYNHLYSRIQDITDSDYYNIVDELVSEGKILSADQKGIDQMIFERMSQNPSLLRDINREIYNLEYKKSPEDTEPKKVLDTSDWVPLQTNPEFKNGIAQKLINYYRENFPEEIDEEDSERFVSRVESIVDTETFRQELQDLADEGGLSPFVDIQISEGTREDSIPRMKRRKDKSESKFDYSRDKKDYDRFVKERIEEDGIPVERLRSESVNEVTPTRHKVLKDVDGAVDTVWKYIQESPDFNDFLDYVSDAYETEAFEPSNEPSTKVREATEEPSSKMKDLIMTDLYNKKNNLEDYVEKSKTSKESSLRAASNKTASQDYSLRDNMNGFNCKQIKVWASEINSLGTRRVAVKVAWDKESAEGVYPWNISQAIRTYIHSLEAADYVQDENLGLIGYPRIVEFDLDKGTAKVIVASTNATSFPSALVEGSAAVERKIKI